MEKLQDMLLDKLRTQFGHNFGDTRDAAEKILAFLTFHQLAGTTDIENLDNQVKAWELIVKLLKDLHEFYGPLF